MSLCSDSKRKLWHWRQAVIERLATLRLTVHPQAQVTPVQHGIPWLGFLVYPPIAWSKPAMYTTFAVGYASAGRSTVPG